MANHGILPHDGKNIKLTVLGEAMVSSFNFSPSLVKDTVGSVAGLYGRDHIDLGYGAAQLCESILLSSLELTIYSFRIRRIEFIGTSLRTISSSMMRPSSVRIIHYFS